jgi:tetratricopeptide (TPR) repeat protein
VARRYLEQAIAMAEQTGDVYAAAWSRGYLGAALVALGEYGPAKKELESAATMARGLPEPASNITIWALGFMGDIPFAEGDNEAAARLYREALELAEQVHDYNSLTYSSRRLGYLALREQRYAEAEAFFKMSLEANQQLGHLQGINRCLAAFACLRAATGESTRAVELCGAVDSLLRKMSASFFHWDETFFKDVVASLRKELPPAAFDRAWARGQKLSLDEAVARAVSGKP